MSGSIQALKIRCRVQLQDMISYGALGRGARVLVGLARLIITFSPVARIARQTALIRLLGSGALRTWFVARVQASVNNTPKLVVQAHATFGTKGLDSAPVTRTAMMKAPGSGGERGVLYSLFEYNWARIAAGTGDLRALLAVYDVIWVASWSPTDYLPLARILADSDPATLIYVQASNMAEIPLLEAFHPRIRVVPFLPCEAIDPRAFAPLSRDKRDIDLLVISNWAPFKRHFELFRALQSLPPELRIVCVGQPETGHTREEIRNLAASYRVPQAIEFHESIPAAEVRALQVRSRAAAIFSRREGHCMSAVEALFADASLGLMDGGHVGPVVYINEQTGVALRPGFVGADLMRLIADSERRSPREWALANLGADRAAEKLNAWLGARAGERDLPWTTDAVRISWSPYPWVDSAESRALLGRGASALHEQFPGVFGAGLLDQSRY